MIPKAVMTVHHPLQRRRPPPKTAKATPQARNDLPESETTDDPDHSTAGSDSDTTAADDSESSNDSVTPPADEAPASEGSEGDTTGQDSGDSLPESEASDDLEVTPQSEPLSDPEPYEPVSSDDGDSEPDGTKGDLVETNAESDAGNSYIATITPDAVAVPGSDDDNTIPGDYEGLVGGTEGNFTITFTEVGDKVIGSAQVEIPGGFSGISFNNDWSPDNISTSGSQQWEGKLDGMFIYLRALNAESYLEMGESVEATFIATTPATTGVYEFETEAWITHDDIAFGSGAEGNNNMSTGYSDPAVVVGTSVSTASELNAVRDDLDGHYVQTADINLDVVPYNTDLGWSPIGNDSNYFTGSYNGNGKTIRGLYINLNETNLIGLFGFTVASAELSNINLDGVNITGQNQVGGLVGANFGAITNSYVTGSVTGKNDVGGLVGYNKEGTINNSYATCTVNGTKYVGGLVGGNEGGMITISYATGEVNGTGDDVGGLVGFNGSINSNINNSYATGNVEGADNVGGLIGRNYGLENTTITVENSYATGMVTGTGSNVNVGGLVGYNNSLGTITSSYATGEVTGTGNYIGGLVGHNNGTVTNSFWNTETSGQSNSAGGEGKTTSEMQQLATFFEDWDISDQGGESTAWRIYEGSTYPLLRHFFAETATITVTDDSRVYNGTKVFNNGGYTLQEGKDNTWVYGEGAYYLADSKNAGDVGVTLMGVYSEQLQYDLVFEAGTVTITPRSLVLRDFTANNKVYDGTTGVTGAGFNDDRFSDDELTFSYDVAFEDKNVGTGKAVNYTNISISSGADQGNYNLVTTTGTAAANITPKSLTITANDITKTFGQPYTFKGTEFSTAGLAAGDEVVSAVITSAGADENAETGNYAINISDAEGTDLANYVITYVEGLMSVVQPAGDSQFTFSDPVTLPGFSGLTAINGGSDAIITPAFVTGGSATDLNRAIAAYDQAMQSLEVNFGSMSAAERAVAEIELAVAGAAIKTLQLVLAARNGAAVELTELLAAYQAARAVFNSNRGLLSADQVAEAQALLDAIAAVIGSFST